MEGYHNAQPLTQEQRNSLQMSIAATNVNTIHPNTRHVYRRYQGAFLLHLYFNHRHLLGSNGNFGTPFHGAPRVETFVNALETDFQARAEGRPFPSP